MGKVAENELGFKDVVLEVIGMFASMELDPLAEADDSAKLVSVLNSADEAAEVVRAVEKRLHIIINDTCMDDDIGDMTIAEFAEHIRQHII